jgi:hypothetical protein
MRTLRRGVWPAWTVWNELCAGADKDEPVEHSLLRSLEPRHHESDHVIEGATRRLQSQVTQLL